MMHFDPTGDAGRGKLALRVWLRQAPRLCVGFGLLLAVGRLAAPSTVVVCGVWFAASCGWVGPAGLAAPSPAVACGGWFAGGCGWLALQVWGLAGL